MSLVSSSRPCRLAPASRRRCAARRAAATAAAAAATAPEELTSPKLGLRVTVTTLPNSRRRLRAEIPVPVLKSSYDATLAELSAEASLPGFRKGATVPAAVLIGAMTPPKFRSAAAEHLLQAVFEDATASVAEIAFGDSLETTTPMAQLEAAFGGNSCAPSSPAFLEMEVDVQPTLAWKAPYAALRVSSPPVPTPASVAGAAAASLAAKLRGLASLRVVTDRGLAAGDVARLSISACKVSPDGSDGPAIPSLQLENIMFDTDEQGAALPGFVAAAAGLKAGEKLEFELQVPRTWKAVSLRGVPARWRVACSELFSREVPLLTDEGVASKVHPGAASPAEAEAGVAAEALAHAVTAHDAALREAVILALCEAADCELPASLTQSEGRTMYASALLEKQASGSLSASAMEQLLSPALVASWVAQKGAEISARVKAGLALSAVAAEQGIAVSDEQIDAKVEKNRAEAAAAFGPAAAKEQEEGIDAAGVREQTAELLQQAAVVDWLLQRAVVSAA